MSYLKTLLERGPDCAADEKTNCRPHARFEKTGPVTLVDKYHQETQIDHCEAFERFFEMIDETKRKQEVCHKPARLLRDVCDVNLRLSELEICNRFGIDLIPNENGGPDQFHYYSHKFCIEECDDPNVPCE